MNSLKIRNVTIGEGVPKICVPIVGMTREDILCEAGKIADSSADIVEWRADWYEDVFNPEESVGVLKELRGILKEMPILFTFRTAREGGEKEIAPEDYASLNLKAAESGCADLIDVEAFTGDEIVEKMIEGIHKCGAKVIASNHDFEKTPGREEIVRRLLAMQDAGADIVKIAVMPRTRRDVLTLLEATEDMREQYADRPFITMSMGRIGGISRLCGETFGQAVTFGASGMTSAPGQMQAEDLKKALMMLHGNS
ncbi:MAG: type I 3-dehydroquinate dehydratase [Bariatricus sp.]|nr:type I 3-dehydroquinate dehydratase [Bariatricus sp.]